MNRRGPIVLVAGTRPEAIKLAPVQRALERAGTPTVWVSTGQHDDLLRATIEALDISVDHDLKIMEPGQTPNTVLAKIASRLPALLTSLQPPWVVVQGDTTSALAATLVAYHLRIPVAHVEAGLRTYDHRHPFPEEGNRQLIDRLVARAFAPTEGARRCLLEERIEEDRIMVVGNTAVDSLLWALDRSRKRLDRPTVLLTLHRRESFGEPLTDILQGVIDFLEVTPESCVLWPVHPNPAVQAAAAELWERHPRLERDRLQRISPLGYLDFVGALATCRVVVSDSGGIQEEAPSLGKTVLVARESTERPEAIDSGANRLVGRTRQGVREGLEAVWSAAPYDGPLPAPNPYGDGQAGTRIAGSLRGHP